MGKKILGYVLMAVGTVIMVFGSQIGMGTVGWKIFALGAMMIGGTLVNQAIRADMRDALNQSLSMSQGLQANVRTSQTPIPLIYGRQKVGGNFLYIRTAGADNKELHMVMGICEGPIDAIEEVYFNQDLVWRNGALTDTPLKSLITFDYRLGTDVQTAFSQVTAIDADFTDRYIYTAVAYFRLDYDVNLWRGVPQVTFIIRGKTCYDPRDTNTKWTQAGPLQWRDMMTNTRYGAGVDVARMDDVAIGEAATYCEAVVVRGGNLVVYDEHVAFGSGYLGTNEVIGNPWWDYSDRWHGDTYIHLPLVPGSISVNIDTSGDNGWISLVCNDAVGDGNYRDIGGTIRGYVNYATGEHFFYKSWSGDSWGLGYVSYRAGQRVFSFRVAYPQIVGSSIAIKSYKADGTVEETFTDNGAGVLTGSLGGTGTVNYTTGEISVTFKLSPMKQTAIKIQYTHDRAPRFNTNFVAISGSPVLDVNNQMILHFRGQVVFAGGYYKLRIEKPEAYVMSFRSGGAEDSGNNILDGTFEWRMPGMADIPTRLVLKWMDPLEGYRVKDFVYDIPGASGSRKEISLDLYGITELDPLERIAETQAKLIMLGTTCVFKTTLPALALEPGEVVRITHPAAGWTDKEFRVLKVSDILASEQVELSLTEYDGTAYVDSPGAATLTLPPPPVSALPDAMPPNITGLTATEFWKLQKDGTWGSYVRLSWAVPTTYPYVDAFEIYQDVIADGVFLRKIGETRGGIYEFGPLKEGVTTSFLVCIRSIYGVRWEGRGARVYLTPVGKTGVPTMPTFNATTSTFSDRVVLNWNPIADKDLGNYEVRTDLNWGNATNRVYLGKATSFWMQASSPSYTFYLKSIDTSGNYSTNYDTINLSNGAPTAPSPSTDYIGRDCIVKWGPSQDLDFAKWVLTIYSDASRTVLKRTVEMTSPGYIYTYDQIQADFGGAGAPGTIYFRIVTHDRFGSTTSTDFSATQATPAIVQFDGGSVERVRIGALGGGVYGARFKDSAGNITFEQGDTLKQKYMKIDEMEVIRTVSPLHFPFSPSTDSGNIKCSAFCGEFFGVVKSAALTTFYGAAVGYLGEARIDLVSLWTAGSTINYIAVAGWGTSMHAAFATASNGLYFGVWGEGISTFSVALTPVQIYNSAVSRPHFGYVDSGNFTIVWWETGNLIKSIRVNASGTVLRAAVTAKDYSSTDVDICGVFSGPSGATHVLVLKTSTNDLAMLKIAQDGTLTSETSIGVVGSYYIRAVGIISSATPSEARWLLFHLPASGNDTLIYLMAEDGTIISTTHWYHLAPFLYSALAANFMGGANPATYATRIPFVGVGREMANSSARYISIAMFQYAKVTNQNLANSLTQVAI